MPRVTTVKARATRKPGQPMPTCTGCRKPIEVGDQCYKWSRKFGRGGATYYRHTDCGYPRPTELTSRKTAQVEEAIQDAGDTIEAWKPELGNQDPPQEVFELDCTDVESALEDAASSAEEVGQEYEDGADAMPDALQYGSQAEAMRAVAGELFDWAQTVRDWSPDVTEVDLPARDDFSDDEDGLAAWREAAQEAIDGAADAIRSEAKDAMDDLPEYQG